MSSGRSTPQSLLLSHSLTVILSRGEDERSNLNLNLILCEPSGRGQVPLDLVLPGRDYRICRTSSWKWDGVERGFSFSIAQFWFYSTETNSLSACALERVGMIDR